MKHVLLMGVIAILFMAGCQSAQKDGSTVVKYRYMLELIQHPATMQADGETVAYLPHKDEKAVVTVTTPYGELKHNVYAHSKKPMELKFDHAFPGGEGATTQPTKPFFLKVNIEKPGYLPVKISHNHEDFLKQWGGERKKYDRVILRPFSKK